jgi:hypothetical protein
VKSEVVEKGRFSSKGGFTTTKLKERRSAMEVEISVPEDVSSFKEIRTNPEKVLEMIRLDVRQMCPSGRSARFKKMGCYARRTQ